VTIFVSLVNPKKKRKKEKRKKKEIDPATRDGCDPLLVAAIHPNGQGERDLATPSGHFCLSDEQKKKFPVSLKNHF
jgi:hypothetical protein